MRLVGSTLLLITLYLWERYRVAIIGVLGYGWLRLWAEVVDFYNARRLSSPRFVHKLVVVSSQASALSPPRVDSPPEKPRLYRMLYVPTMR